MRVFKDKAFWLWRPDRHRNMVRAPKTKSKLVEFEPESIGVSTNNRPPIVAPRILVTKLTMAIAYWRKLITLGAGPASRGHEPLTIKRKEVELKRGAGGRVSTLAISICFGLIVCCGMVIAMLFTQIRDMKSEIASLKLRLAGVNSHLSWLEGIAQQKIIKEAKTAETPTPPRRIQINLSNDDIKLIRAFIKVLPSQPGAQPKIQLGQEVSAISTVPVPGSVVGQIPKLRGARFLVDDNGAIIIVGEGSNRADVLIEPQ
jgi:hypothetical protein